MGWFDTIGKLVVAGLVLAGIIGLVQPAMLQGLTGGESGVVGGPVGTGPGAEEPQQTVRPTSTQSDAVAGDADSEASTAGLSR